MTLKQTVIGSMLSIGVILAIVLPGGSFSLPLGVLLAAGILYVWGFQPEVPRVTQSLASKALEMSRDAWIVAYIDPYTLEGCVEMELQCFLREDELEELLVYPDHPQFETFKELELKSVVEFSVHMRGVEGADVRVLSSYLSVFRVYPPGTFIHPKRSKVDSHSSVVH